MQKCPYYPKTKKNIGPSQGRTSFQLHIQKRYLRSLIPNLRDLNHPPLLGGFFLSSHGWDTCLLRVGFLSPCRCQWSHWRRCPVAFLLYVDDLTLDFYPWTTGWSQTAGAKEPLLYTQIEGLSHPQLTATETREALATAVEHTSSKDRSWSDCIIEREIGMAPDDGQMPR